MTKQDIHAKLVSPVCALEEYCKMSDCSPIVDTVAIALRHILDEIEEDAYSKESKHEN